MRVENFNYHFKKRDPKDVALTLGVIYNDLGYSKIDKAKISKLYNVTYDAHDKNYINKFINAVETLDTKKQNHINLLCEQLNKQWQDYKNEYLDIINRVLDIKIDNQIVNHTYCYLHSLPINEISLNDNIIYLDYNKSVEEVFTNFIIMLTKLLLITRWNYVNNWNFNKEFDVKNRVWMFAEIAIDAIFCNSDLNNVCKNVSYKYLYSLNIKGINVMEYFRKLYKTKPLDDFFTEVYLFVHENHKALLHFKNYLY